MASFNESILDDGNSMANFSFDITGGSAKSEYQVVSSDAVNLQSTITSILGYTETAASSSPQVNRTVPLRHPRFPYLYASRISSLTGVGSATSSLQPAVNPPLVEALQATPITSEYRQYAMYKIGVEFSGPRTYPMVNNSIIPTQQSSWVKPDGSSQSYSWAPEYLRYCDFDIIPQDNQIQASQGSMTLWKGAGVTLTSPPWMYLPDYIMKITWYQIPYRYILSSRSYIAASPWKGRINQNYMWLWPPGWLMYLTYNVKKYAPPTGYAQTLQNSQGLYTYFNWAQLCDVELVFLVTNRFASGSIGFTPSNGNYVLGKQADGTPGAGHNWQPDLTTGKYHYVTRNDANGDKSTNNPPAWLSAPLECLFSDPDCGSGPDLV